MFYQTLVSTEEVAAHLEEPDWVILDCRFSLAEPLLFQQKYREAHLPGASYADLNHDLSSPHLPGITGRHPLPAVNSLSQKFSNWGIADGAQVVCYDDAGGALAAARAWWLLRWLGHSNVAVLDGGWQKWLAENRPIRAGVESRTHRSFWPTLRPELLATAGEVDYYRRQANWRVLDARAFERFCGLNETIDPVAGHIPGAISAPYAENLSADQTFQSVKTLRQHYSRLLGDLPAEQSVVYCGSGVTAAHDVLAMLHAGLGEARLYTGSWSEWITDPSRPVSAAPD